MRGEDENSGGGGGEGLEVGLEEEHMASMSQ